jgi:5-methylcytosine-specific restriction endonuclease McrA
MLEEILLKNKPQKLLKDRARKTLGSVCIYCGDECEELTADHIKPKTKGGQTAHWNLVGACKNCNRSKGSKDVWEWWRGSHHWREAVADGRDKKLVEIINDRRSLADFLVEDNF